MNSHDNTHCNAVHNTNPCKLCGETATPKRHPFSYTLGYGPYHFRFMFTIIKPSEACPTGNYHTLPTNLKAGCGTCAHCGQGIMNVFVISIGNGDLYGVGCDCVANVGLPTSQLTAVQKAKAAHEKQLRDARKKAKQKKEWEELTSKLRPKLSTLAEEYGDEYKICPHPSYPDKSLLDYIGWVLRCGSYLNTLSLIKNLETGNFKHA